MLLYGLYLAFIATDRFVSESVISVRQDGGGSASGAPRRCPAAGRASARLRTKTRCTCGRSCTRRRWLLELDAQAEAARALRRIAPTCRYRLPDDASREDFVALLPRPGRGRVRRSRRAADDPRAGAGPRVRAAAQRGDPGRQRALRQRDLAPHRARTAALRRGRTADWPASGVQKARTRTLLELPGPAPVCWTRRAGAGQPAR